MSSFTFKEKPPIDFSLRVIATDLPVTDKNFKIKMAMDFIPDFEKTTEPTNPNFNGKRVAEILEFISDDVIKKVIEFVYYDRSNEYSSEEKADYFDDALKIYNDRRSKLDALKPTTPEALAKQQEEIKSTGEASIKKLVTSFMNKPDREPTQKERNVSSIRFEHFSPSRLLVSVQSVVNGEKKLPLNKPTTPAQ